MNVSAAFVFQLALVIPLSLFVLLVHNWVLGSMACFMLPMIQVGFIWKLTVLCNKVRCSFAKFVRRMRSRKKMFEKAANLVPSITAYKISKLGAIPYFVSQVF